MNLASMKSVFILCITLILINFFSNDLSAQVKSGKDKKASFQLIQSRNYPIIDKILSNKMKLMSEDEKVKVWIFFTDKGIFTERHYLNAILVKQQNLLPASRHRRAKIFTNNLLDFYDLPVRESYVEKLAESGAGIRRRSKWLNAVSVEVDKAALRMIRVLAFVRKIQLIGRYVKGPFPEIETDSGRTFENELDANIQGTEKYLLSYGASFDQVNQINVPALHDMGFSGNGVSVCMMDTGYNKEHESLLTRKIIAERDFIFDDDNTQNEQGDVTTQQLHGTGTFSVLGGYSEGNLIGPAYGASFLLAKTEDIRSETRVEEDNWIAGMEWADSLGADIISSSLGYLRFDDGGGYAFSQLDGKTAATSIAASIAASRGIVVCNSMGNGGPQDRTLVTPADTDSILSVGAVDESNQIAAFSSRGPTADNRTKPDVVARGVRTLWATALNTAGYARASGTSLSTPLVAGSTALLLEAHPDWRQIQVIDALKQTADNSSSPNNTIGWGLIDVLGAATQIEPLRHPLPFSLISPSNGDTLSTITALSWYSSSDPNSGIDLNYELTVDIDSAFTAMPLSFVSRDTIFIMSSFLLSPEEKYYWKVTAVDAEGLRRDSREVMSFVNSDLGSDLDVPDLTANYFLFQNFPNPFNGVTSILFNLPQNMAIPQSTSTVRMTIKIYDIRGRLVRTLVSGSEPSGIFVANWDARDDDGVFVSAGIYFCRMESRVFSSTIKISFTGQK